MAKSTIRTAIFTVAGAMAIMLAQANAEETSPKKSALPATGLPSKEEVESEAKPGRSTDWPQWRGPDRNGEASASPKLLDVMPPGGPKMFWKSEFIPASFFGGWGCPVVAEGKVFLLVHWIHPKDGKYRRPVTAKFLELIGWIPGVPDDLAKKVEDAWASPTRPDAAKCPELRVIASDKFNLDEFLTKQPELDKYIKDFISALPPEVVQKYGAFVKRRLCMRPQGWYGGEPSGNVSSN